MSPKELLYIEDVLSQEQQAHKLYNSFASQLQDPQLRSFVQGLASKKQQCYDKFYGLLG
jgi:rubrerythrin